MLPIRAPAMPSGQVNEGDRGIILPALQNMLQLSYAPEVDKQLNAAVELSKMVQGNPIPVASFGPLSHALCRLASGNDRTVVSYAARGIKLLVLDDALRPQAAIAGIPVVLVEALKNWEEEVPCLREVLGALQTLCCDKSSVGAVVDAGLVVPLTDLLDTPDLELRRLVTATAANTLAFSDTLLLTKEACIDTFCDAMPDLLDSARRSV
ncbi:unnamed protein product [Discosporangium mesarthrocarpum]